MLLRALKAIPGTIQIFPGQQFHELNVEAAEMWLRDGLAEKVELDKPRYAGGLHWEGCEVLILASGPSLDEAQVAAAERWREGQPRRRVIVINTTFRMAPWADVLYACDARWWSAKDQGAACSHYEEALDSFKGKLWSQTENAKPHDFPHVQLMKSERGNGLNERAGTINTGMNSGFQAIGLAWQAGARRMYLLGYDLRDIDGKTHWHGDHPKPIRAKNQYQMWLAHYKILAKDLIEQGVEVVNLTPDSALREFPTAKWDEVLL